MSKLPVALITGITGQDGSYLAEHLVHKDYTVHGIIRRSSSFNTARIDHLLANNLVKLHYGDLTDPLSMERLIEKVWPDEVYNLGAQSHVRVSFDQPVYTADTVFMGTLRLLEAIRNSKCEPRIYQASSSEMYGDVLETPQNEGTPFNPQSPYAVAKVAAHQICRNYREAYGMHISCGILFNHESPRRGETFVTRKIAKAAARIYQGKEKVLPLGNLNAKRDWGFAGDYVKGMHLMLQQEIPDDYVLATGETHSVEEFLFECFHHVGLRWQDWVYIDDRYKRPTEVDLLLGDPRRAKQELGWEPTVKFQELAQMMVDAELKLL